MHICKGLDVSPVPRTGLEPVHREVLVFETNASTNSAIWAFAGAKLQKNIEPRKYFHSNYVAVGCFLCSSRLEIYSVCRYFSASRAALQPLPAATIA